MSIDLNQLRMDFVFKVKKISTRISFQHYYEHIEAYK